MKNEASRVTELRSYTLHPGKRDTLIDLFERELLEPQEAVGMRIVGQFRDMEDPDRFVWIRSFHDMEQRRQALAEFYGGPVWKAHREAANATMIDSDDVLLLRPAHPDSVFVIGAAQRPPAGGAAPGSLVVATIYAVTGAADDFVDFFERVVQPALTRAGSQAFASFVTEDAPNTFPALPVRDGANVFVTFARFSDSQAYIRHTVALERAAEWQLDVAAALAKCVAAPPEVLKLMPTARSGVR